MYWSSELIINLKVGFNLSLSLFYIDSKIISRRFETYFHYFLTSKSQMKISNSFSTFQESKILIFIFLVLVLGFILLKILSIFQNNQDKQKLKRIFHNGINYSIFTLGVEWILYTKKDSRTRSVSLYHQTFK